MESRGLTHRSVALRSMMFFALLAAPVISIAGFSGGASAGVSNPLSAEVECVDNGTTVTVTLNNSQSQGNSFYWRASIDGVFVHTVNQTSDLNVTYENGSNASGFKYDAARTYDPSDGTYSASVYKYTRADGSPAAGNQWVYTEIQSYTVSFTVNCEVPPASFTATAVENCFTGKIDVIFGMDDKDRRWEISLKVGSSYVKQHTGFLYNGDSDPDEYSGTLSIPMSANATYDVKVELLEGNGNPKPPGGTMESPVVVNCGAPPESSISRTVENCFSEKITAYVDVPYPQPRDPQNNNFYWDGSIAGVGFVPINDVRPRGDGTGGSIFMIGVDPLYSLGQTYDIVLERYTRSGSAPNFVYTLRETYIGTHHWTCKDFTFGFTGLPATTVFTNGSNGTNGTNEGGILPRTGSDGNFSLLVLAPMMVLLGGGVILARRRLANV